MAQIRLSFFLTRKVSYVNITHKDIDGEKYGIVYIPESRGNGESPAYNLPERTLRSCKLKPKGSRYAVCSRYRASVSKVNAKRGHTVCMAI